MKHRLGTHLGLVAALALVSVLTLPTSSVRATTVIEQDLADLCNGADMIFVGKVISVQPRYSDETRRSIETVVTFAVLDSVKGADHGDVALRFSGGEMNGLREVVAGMPEYKPGEEVLLFATNKPTLSPIVGFHQGSFRVVEGDGGKVVLNTDNAPLTAVKGRSLFFGKSQDGTRGAVPLNQFLDTVRQQLGRQGQGNP